MKQCIFCKIISGQAPAYKVYEDDKILAFLDTKPFTNGHTLIIPKVHYDDMLDIPEDVLSRIILMAKQLALKYKDILKAEGFNIRQSSGVIAHQDVLHYHLHLVPRYQGDGLELRAFGKAPELRQLSSIHDEIRASTK
jgi:histidine triad (HIT) family protein